MTPTNVRPPLPSEAPDTLDQALARLGAAPVPDGLEQRILNRLATHAATQQGTSSRLRRLATPMLQRPFRLTLQRLLAPSLQRPHLPSQPRLVSPSLQHVALSLKPRPVLLGGLAVVAVALTVGGLRFASITSPPGISNAHNKVPTRQEQAPIQPTPTQIAPIPAAASPAARSLSPTGRPATIGSGQSRPLTNQNISPDEALALAELHAPSQLAPPLPLTDDERALQHLAQHSTPEVLSALNSGRNDAQLLAEQAAFQSFFTKPVVPVAKLKGETN